MKLFANGFKKSVVFLLALSFVLTYGFCFASAAETDFAITNPYANINWDAVKQFKADLHCHTTASDGNDTLKESVERHYELGFDILAITDHGTIDYNWTDGHVDPDVKMALSIKDGEIKPVVPLEFAGTAANGNSYVLADAENGDTYYTQTAADGTAMQDMMRVPFGNEHNAASFNNAHVNSWFVDWGDGMLAGTIDYVTALSGIAEAGGVSVINHPGEYSNARDEIYTADAYNRDTVHYNYTVDKYENLLLDYPNCIGIDINSKGDSRTRFDRKLWDMMLTDLIPQGRTVYAIATSDAHNLDIVDSGFTLHLLEDLNNEAFRSNLENGEFFAASKYVGNADELTGYAAALLDSDDADKKAFGAELKAIADAIYAENAEGGEGTGNKFRADNTVAGPQIDAITVDDEADTITLDCDNAMLITWVSDGKVVATGNSVDLDELEGLGNYIRAEIINEGGIVYTQAFVLEYEGVTQGDFNHFFFDFGTGVGKLIQFILEAITSLPFFEIIWETLFA